jgi:hypothetical protein
MVAIGHQCAFAHGRSVKIEGGEWGGIKGSMRFFTNQLLGPKVYLCLIHNANFCKALSSSAK